MGRASEGLALIAESLALVEQTGERWYEAELHRLDGELLLRAQTQPRSDARRAKPSRRPAAAGPASDHRGPGDTRRSAEGCFRTAIDVARRQQAKALELRAATSLSRLWQQEGKRQPAREILAEVYAWFSEGFDTADLQDARRLLADLS
jgi:adenylate cyclase